jgi:hypothetical protein
MQSALRYVVICGTFFNLMNSTIYGLKKKLFKMRGLIFSTTFVRNNNNKIIIIINIIIQRDAGTTFV